MQTSTDIALFVVSAWQELTQDISDTGTRLLMPGIRERRDSMSKEAAKYILEMARHLSDADFRRELKPPF